MTAPLGWNQSKIIARLFCASPATGNVEVDPAEAATLDGSGMVPLAAGHGLAEVLYATLARLSFLEILAEPDRSRLQLEHIEALRRHRSRTEQMARLHTALHRHGIPYILLKEHAFDTNLPAAECIRQNDFDILVRPADLSPAERVLVSLGYARVARPWPGEFRFKSEGRLSVDLHTSLGAHHDRHDEFFDEEAAFARIRRIEVASELVPVLHPQDGALFLVLHTALHHNFTPFKTVVNCWNYIASRERELSVCPASTQARNILWLTLRYMEEITGYELEWKNRMAPPSSLTRRLFHRLLPDAHNYFAEDVDPNLRRACRTGLHLCLYPPTLREKLLCLARIARIRAAAWL